MLRIGNTFVAVEEAIMEDLGSEDDKDDIEGPWIDAAGVEALTNLDVFITIPNDRRFGVGWASWGTGCRGILGPATRELRCVLSADLDREYRTTLGRAALGGVAGTDGGRGGTGRLAPVRGGGFKA